MNLGQTLIPKINSLSKSHLAHPTVQGIHPQTLGRVLPMNFQCSTINPEERIKNLMTKMETWLFIIISLCVAAFLKSLYDFFFPKLNLPPGPTRVPLIGNFLLFRKSLSDFEPVLRNLHSKYGPILTVHFGSRPVISVSSDSLSHQALVQKGAVFADRTEALPISKIFSSNKHTISTAFYGPTWRVLRRNLTAEILHPSRVRSYAHARKWVLGILLSRLTGHSGPVRVVDHFRYAMFCLLVLMCFGTSSRKIRFEKLRRFNEDCYCVFVASISSASGRGCECYCSESIGRRHCSGISIVDEDDFKRVLENDYSVLSCVCARLHYLNMFLLHGQFSHSWKES